MGTYSKSNFGTISGKVGEGVASKWRGKKVLRSLPTKSSKPASALQLAVYAKFALSAAQLSPIKDLLKVGFSDKKLNKITGYNAAVKLFINSAIVGDYPNFEVDYPSMSIAKGSLKDLAEMVIGTDDGISLSWNPSVNIFNAYADDRVVALAYNVTKNSYNITDDHSRSDGDIATPFSGSPGDELHIWAFCIKRDGSAVSNSSYAGSVVMPV